MPRLYNGNGHYGVFSNDNVSVVETGRASNGTIWPRPVEGRVHPCSIFHAFGFRPVCRYAAAASDTDDKSGQLYADWQVISNTRHLIQSSCGVHVSPTSDFIAPVLFDCIVLIGELTAWKLAGDGHKVIILSPDPIIAKELERSAADMPLRGVLKKPGADWKVDVWVTQWRGNGATVLDHNSGESTFIAAGALVLATTSFAANDLALAPRQAPCAFHDGRIAGLGV